MTTRLVRIPVFALALCILSSLSLPAQSKSKAGSSSKSGSSSSGSSGGGSGSSSGGGGGGGGGEASGGPPFSIETEMFTYKAVQHNSAAIACDTAQFLFQGQVADAPAGAHAPCSISGASGARPGIILVSSDSTLLSDFQVWRADMATMQSLAARAKQTCVAPEKAGEPGAPQPTHLRSRGLLGSALSSLATPDAASAAAGSIMQMLSSSESVTSVIGTVEDPALMNEVARQLRSLNVQVLVPELYNPNALGAINAARSPYLQSLATVFDTYDKCSEAKAGYSANAPQIADIDALLGGVKDFLTATFAAPPKFSGNSGSSSADSGSQTQGTPSAPPSHLSAVLGADELAQKIGFSPAGTADPNSPWQHLLWLKALESGGSVTKQSSILGSKVLFGGGAVDTYAVFGLDGALVCSGNVYSFQRPVKVKEFDKAVRAPSPDTPAKWESEHSTCAPLASN